MTDEDPRDRSSSQERIRDHCTFCTCRNHPTLLGKSKNYVLIITCSFCSVSALVDRLEDREPSIDRPIEMGEHFAAASSLALVLNFLLLWVAAPGGIAGRTEDGLSLQWEKAPPPPPMREVELGVVRLKRGAKRYGHDSFTVHHTRE